MHVLGVNWKDLERRRTFELAGRVLLMPLLRKER